MDEYYEKHGVPMPNYAKAAEVFDDGLGLCWCDEGPERPDGTELVVHETLALALADKVALRDRFRHVQFTRAEWAKLRVRDVTKSSCISVALSDGITTFFIPDTPIFVEGVGTSHPPPPSRARQG